MSNQIKTPHPLGLAAQAPRVPLRRRSGPAWLAGVMSALRAWRERYRQERVLDALSDHMLDDIGIPRTDRDRDGWRCFPRD